MNRIPLLLALLLALLLPAAGGLTTPASAAARVTVANEFGDARADLTYSTRITVSGSGFQSVQGGFGGIYVLFGWVSGGGWQPSQGGATGSTYRYVPDTEGAANAGFQRFVSFPGSETAASANGGTIAADGSWRVQMVIPGPTFTALDRDGGPVSVDCRSATCGIITVGAHGVTNSANETFTPVQFDSIFGSEPAGTTEQPAGGSAAGTGSAGTTDDADAGATTEDDGTAPSGPAVLVDRSTAVAGKVLSFTGSGLVPGEQVLATLDDGLVSVGPLPVTGQGTVAGLLELPESLANGNHELRLTGTTTGGVPVLTFAVQSDAGAVEIAEQADATPVWSPGRIFFLAGAVALLMVVTAVVTARLTRRRLARAAARRAPRPADGPAPAGPAQAPAGPSPAPAELAGSRP
jgi:hypothetical protein